MSFGRSIVTSGMVQQQNAPGALPYAADVAYGSGPPKGGTVQNVAYGTKAESPYIRGVADPRLPTPTQALTAMRLTCEQWAAMSDDAHFDWITVMMLYPASVGNNPQLIIGENGRPLLPPITPAQARDVRSIITAINAECLHQGVQAQGEIGRSTQNVYDYGTRARK